MRILLVNGPNLNTLGQREPEIYGHETLNDIVDKVARQGESLGAQIVAFQSNHEGELIDFIQENAAQASGLIINGGAFTHTSIALRDAIAGSGLPTIEIHISNVHARERFRHHSYISAVARGVIVGLGWRGYLYALEAMVDLLKEGN
jgi:3-dehydroquinate dehydratase-2